MSEAAFRHVILPVLRSGFLGAKGTRLLKRTYKPVAYLVKAIQTYSMVNYHPLQEYVHQRLPANELMPQLSAMTTACLLDFDLDVAAAVRWMAGTHTAAHQDPESILATLRPAVDADILQDLRRILTVGCPALCQAEATEANFKAAYTYGNHQSIYNNIEKTKKALTKEARNGYVLVLDPLLSFFVPHMHRTPIGLINQDSPYKKVRLIFDASSRPEPSSYAINDWTHKGNEPPPSFSHNHSGGT